MQSQIITLTTTSKSNVWSPNKVTKNGEPLIWKATASGMTDQVIVTNGSPTFNLSLPRNSAVSITATSNDGSSGFTELGINSLNITSLIVDNAVSLKLLSCTDNLLKELDVTNNTKLTELLCHSNQISILDVTKNIELFNLACFSNYKISILDLSKNTLLTTLSCSNNLLTDLDLSSNTQLTSLECNSNRLENLNIQNGNNTIIESFNTTNNINLFCIQVDDVNYSAANWKEIDTWTSFNKDCTFTNESPIANDDKYETMENTNLTIEPIGILINDIDPDEDILMAVLETDVTHGNLELYADGSFVYIPDQNYYGIDSFTYKANDGEFDSNIAIVTIRIILVNSPPVSNENSYLTNENQILDIEKKEGVLSNDEDVDGDILTAHLITDVNSGMLNLSQDGSFIYIPNTSFFGIDNFTYQAFDGLEYSSKTEVKIEVKAITEIVVPNAFSPNNDQMNDTFRPVFKGMSNVRLEIYDTWGNLVYFEEGKNLIGWKGLIKGKDAENGNYLYIVTATTYDEQVIISDGMLTLIK